MFGINTSKFAVSRATFIKLISVILLLLSVWVIYLDAQVRSQFEGQRWVMPAQVFARPLEIYEGKILNQQNLLDELRLLNYQKVSYITKSGQYALNGNQVDLFIRDHQKPDETQKPVHIRFTIQTDQVTDLIKLTGVEKAIYTLEPLKIAGIYPHAKEERQLLSIDEFPPQLIKTLIATEDKQFASHWGLSPTSILRAMWANLKAGEIVQGGSTITQQLVKNFFLTSERSFIRKFNEAIMAILLEVHYSKDLILETYMNDIFLGQSGKLAIHGFEAASSFYFGKHLSECDEAELALLVGMVKGPSYYNPRRYPERAKTRRNLVLSLLHDEGVITKKMLTAAQARPIQTVEKPLQSGNRFPAFMDLVKRQLRETYPEEDLRSEGLKIYTTLDPQVQLQLERASTRRMAALTAVNKQKSLQTASIVTHIGSGEIVAMLGDKQPTYQGFNRALDAKRQIGSLIKPAIYLTALAQPDRYHLATLVNDQAFKLEFKDGQVWQPQNFDKQEHGQVSLLQALANSYNLSSARLGLDLGIPEVHRTLKKLGVEGDINPYPSLFLGSQSLTLMEVSEMYLTIASQGFSTPMRAIRDVTTADNELLSRYPYQVEQVFSPEAVYLLQYAMQQTMKIGTGRSAYTSLPQSLVVAGKTGTTNDNRDSWFAGFSGDYLGVVWLGKDDNTPTAFTGGTGALTVWREFMAAIPQMSVAMVQPDDVHYTWFNQTTGKRTEELCQDAIELPVWGDVDNLEFQSCQEGFSSFKGWLKSWF